METDFLITKDFEKRNIYYGYLCQASKENDKYVIRALYPTIGSLENDMFFDFITKKTYKLIKIENKEEGIYFIYPEKLYVKKIENIPGIKISPIEVFKDYEIKDKVSYDNVKRRVKRNEKKYVRFV